VRTVGLDQLPKLGSTDSKLFRQSLAVVSSTIEHGSLVPTSSKQATSTTGLLKDMNTFNKQLSKNTSALKL